MILKSKEDCLYILNSIEAFLKQNQISFSLLLLDEIIARKNGKNYIFNDYIRAMIYAQLSNNTKWTRIENKLPDIDRLFFNYDKNKIKRYDSRYFEDGIRNLKCGNIAIEKQMSALFHNIDVLEQIEKDFGTLDYFFNSRSAKELVETFSKSNSKYKIKYLGNALAWEFVRYLGVDGAKPDTHIRRILGKKRLGFSERETASENEVFNIIDYISKQTGYCYAHIDTLLWCYCADDYAEICTATPKCHLCCIKRYCNKQI